MLPHFSNRHVLQIEGAAIGSIALGAYFLLGGGWLMLALLILAPDIAMLGYLGGKRAGAFAYNFAHTTSLPLALLGIGWITEQQLAVLTALIWLAHIGLDRAIGYGLKTGDGFKTTHLSAQ
jgi:hypothetical protein